MKRGYKLFSLYKDGTVGSLFIDKKKRLEVGIWYEAKPVQTKGFAFRPGWHICSTKSAPHLSKKKRMWALVEFCGDVVEHKRPESQGGLWYTSKYIKIIKLLDNI